MVTVYTKEELEQALKAKESHIRIKGELAESIKKKIKRQKTAKKIGIGTAAIGAAALIAAPLTGGASLIAGAGATAMGLTVGTVTITVAELAILVGGTVAITALLKGYKKVKMNSDGSIELEK